MKNLSSVLVVLDKPKHAQTALARAKELQAKSGCHLSLAAFCWHPMVKSKDVFDIHQRRAIKKAIVGERRDWLRGLVLDSKLSAADVSTEVVWTDDIADWVTRASATDCDLVVKSVHHSQTLLHTPLDWQLLRECPAPLWLAAALNPGGKARRPTGRILAALDLENADRVHRTLNLKVLETANLVTELSDGLLHCVNVVEHSRVLTDLDLIDTRKVRKQHVERNKALVEGLTSPYGVVKSRIHMPVGKVGQVVNATARKIDADLIVLGTVARRGIGARLLGNSAEWILSCAPCDVLVVHP